MKRRVRVLTALLLLCLMGCGAAVGRLSFRRDFVEAAARQSTYRLDIPAGDRGMIYDCALRPLLQTEEITLAAVAPTIEGVGEIGAATGGRYRERLAAGLEDGKPFTLILENSEAQALSDCPFVELFPRQQRLSGETLAAHVIGVTDASSSGLSGAELAMDDVLSPKGGASVYYQVDALGRVVAGAQRRVVLDSGAGTGVALCLDRDIQAAVEQAAQSLGKGAVVVTQVPHCEIRALASFPSFSPDHLNDALSDPDSPLLNRAFSAYAPGSVFKLVTAAAALEQGRPLADSFVCTGAVNAGGMLFHCYDGAAHGPVDLHDALTRSCNGYFISLGRSLGGESMLSMAWNLGLGEETEFGRGLYAASGALPASDSLTGERALANFSFGQGELSVTPLQMTALVNAIASGGVYSSPRLILGTVGEDGQLTQSHSALERQMRVMSEGSAAVLRACMLDTVTQGTGRAAASELAVTGCKTGTAQTGVFDEDGRELLNFWYCGFVLSPGTMEPQYCLTVLCEGTPDDEGNTARVFRQIAEELAGMMEE